MRYLQCNSLHYLGVLGKSLNYWYPWTGIVRVSLQQVSMPSYQCMNNVSYYIMLFIMIYYRQDVCRRPLHVVCYSIGCSKIDIVLYSDWICIYYRFRVDINIEIYLISICHCKICSKKCCSSMLYSMNEVGGVQDTVMVLDLEEYSIALETSPSVDGTHHNSAFGFKWDVRTRNYLL